MHMPTAKMSPMCLLDYIFEYYSNTSRYLTTSMCTVVSFGSSEPNFSKKINCHCLIQTQYFECDETVNVWI